MENFDFAKSMQEHLDEEEKQRIRQMRLFREGDRLGHDETLRLIQILKEKVAEVPNCSIREDGKQVFISILEKSLHLTCYWSGGMHSGYLFSNIFTGTLLPDFMIANLGKLGLEKRYSLNINQNDELGWVDRESKSNFQTSEELANIWLKAMFERFKKA
jgi:hypothetical protein